MLFDLSKDPGETTNLAEKHPEIVAELTKIAAPIRKELGDSLTGIEEHHLVKVLRIFRQT